MKRRLGILVLCVACLLILPFALSPPAALAAAAPVWSAQNSGTDEWLESVTFVNATTGWVVGDGGTILRTGDGGQTWTAQAAGTTTDLNGVDFVGAYAGWAVGDSGVILHTTDGGATWDPQDSDQVWGLYDVDFVDENAGWAAGNGMILHTSNGGQTWAEQTLPSPPPGVYSFFLESIVFTDSSNGWAAGWDGIILHTDNGGATWSVQGWGTTQDLEDVFFLDANTGWAVGEAGTIARTSNGGVNWSPQSAGTTADLASIWFADSANGCAVGDDGIFQTADGGAAWARYTGPGSGAIDYLRGVTFVSASSGWAVGLGGLVVHSAQPVRLTISAKPAVVAYRGAVSVRGSLRSALGTLLPGRTVVLQRSANGSDWTAVRSLGSSTGTYATTVRITRKTFFRLRFAGDATYAAGASPRCSAISRASLTPPGTPSVVRSGVRYTCYGYIRPQHESGRAPIVLSFYRYVSGAWRLQATLSGSSHTNVSGATRYSFWFQITGYLGSWRVRAMHRDADHARTHSAYRYFSVR